MTLAICRHDRGISPKSKASNNGKAARFCCMLADDARTKRPEFQRGSMLISGRLPHSSQYPPGAISSPARHLAKIEFGHEILRSKRGHFELPGN